MGNRTQRPANPPRRARQAPAVTQNADLAHQPTGTLVGFGYAGLRDSADLRKLLGDDVEVVCDVRIQRWSRNPAFSTITQATIEAAGYRYRWLRGLGNAGHRDGGPMRLADPAEIEMVLAELRTGRNVAVMCACSDAGTCHRRLVIELARQAIPGLVVRGRVRVSDTS
jgi:uncharacterized protein (DUF488 family)